jgi:hypothetical protein
VTIEAMGEIEFGSAEWAAVDKEVASATQASKAAASTEAAAAAKPPQKKAAAKTSIL